MSGEIRTIQREELKARIDAGADVKLVMAMHEWGFRAAHIPGSLHFSTVEQARASLELDDEIIVYCSDPACVASQYAYHWFVDNGYTDVRRYAGGVSDWAAAGYELEGDVGSGGTSLPFFIDDTANPPRRTEQPR